MVQPLDGFSPSSRYGFPFFFRSYPFWSSQVSGTLGMIQAFFVNSIPMAVRRMRQSQLCQDAAAECSTDWVAAAARHGLGKTWEYLR